MIDQPHSETSTSESGFPSAAPVSMKSFGRHEILQVTLDDETVAHLRKPKKFAHVRNEAGHVVGVLTLMPEETAEMYQHALDTVDFDELDRRANDPHPGYTFEQVKERLREIELQEAECGSR